VDCFTLRALVRAANDRLMEARLGRGLRDGATGAPLVAGEQPGGGFVAGSTSYYGSVAPAFFPAPASPAHTAL